MRHRLRWAHGQRARQDGCLALSPASGSSGMHEATAASALVTLGGSALRLASRQGRAATGAVDLATVTGAAHQHRRTAARAQEASGGRLEHEYLGKRPRVCWTQSPTGATLALHPLLHDTV
jgi:hypothetical protein